MRDRATQALVKAALEPEWESKFENNSYGEKATFMSPFHFSRVRMVPPVTAMYQARRGKPVDVRTVVNDHDLYMLMRVC